MTVICDASPLIFLGKLDRLALIRALLAPEVLVLRCVAEEVLAGASVEGPERRRLEDFLAGVRIVDFTESTYASARLSESDRRTLTFAVRNRVAWLVADERLLRRIACGEGILTIGTLGLLAGAVQRGLLSPQAAIADLDAAILRHRFRISAALCQRVRQELASGSDSSEHR